MTAWPCGQNKPATGDHAARVRRDVVVHGRRRSRGRLFLPVTPSIGTHLIVDVTGFAG